jgi:hypothetical protein
MTTLNFQQQLTVGIVNNLLIATIIAGFGLLANRALERYKLRSTFLSGYTAKHIAVISDAWGLMYDWEDFIRRSFRYQSANTDEQWHAIMDDYGKAIEESRRREMAVRGFVDTNRFWLGEELYGSLVNYHNDLENYVRTMLYGSNCEVLRLRDRLTERKQDVMSLLGISRSAMY